MNYLVYGIISVASFFFILIIFLIVSLLKNRNINTYKEQYVPPRCPTCGQILEPDWNRCPFCMDSLQPAKIYHTDRTTLDAVSIGYLIVKTGANRGQIYKIEKNQIQIGNGNQNDIIISDNNVSPQHAKIWLADKKFFINDLHSKNGTKVNNRIIDQGELYDNDLIDIADNFFTFKILD